MKNKDFSKELSKLFESEDANLFIAPKKLSTLTPDDRLAESFQEIVDFVAQHDRKPSLDAVDFNEASLAKRLEGIVNTPWKVESLEEYDMLGLLEQPPTPQSIEELVEDDTFGIFSGEENKIFDIKNVKQKRVVHSTSNKAVRMKVKDFSIYKPIFEESQKMLENGEKKLVPFTTIDQLHVGGLYVNGGQMVYVAEEGDIEKNPSRIQQRLRVIIENGTESNMYKRSLAQRLYEGGSCVVPVNETVNNTYDELEEVKGYIYIVRSMSGDEKINTISNLYKIGFSTTPVSKRVANAKDDPTYLMADVDLVESYKLTGDYNPQKVEAMIHRIFASAALDLRIIDKKGKEHKPMEWYSVPIHVIREAVDLIGSGEIVDYVYDADKESMVKIGKS